MKHFRICSRPSNYTESSKYYVVFFDGSLFCFGDNYHDTIENIILHIKTFDAEEAQNCIKQLFL